MVTVGDSFRFLVAFSFAGPHRDKVRAIAERVSAALDPDLQHDRSQGRVFFDEWFEHEILGSDMDVLLQRLYHDQSLMVAADLSEEYADREWTQAEARAIRALRMKLDTARDETARLRLLNLRLGEGDVPGVFGTEGYLDGNKSAEECADVILKRLALLRQRRVTGGGPGPAPDPGTGKAGAGRSWVWYATLASRAAGQVSVLACAETLFAVLLYWWIAIRYETHWHLVSSVFIAPLLLLRSPESIAAGVRWFMKDWFGLKSFADWPLVKQVVWIGALGFACSVPTSLFSLWLGHRWLPGLQCGALFGWAALIGLWSVAVTAAVAVAGTGAVAGTFALRRALAVACVGACAGVGAMATSFSGAVAAAGVAALGVAALGAGSLIYLLLLPAFGMGMAIRSVFIRVPATLRHLPAGGRHLPANWQENNFLMDSCVPAELMPGIRDVDPSLALDGFARNLFGNKGRALKIALSLMGIFLFVPAFLYRLNLKATAWFWWPLAYLLCPALPADAEGRQKQALCWPWTNPFQTALIVTTVLVTLASLTLHFTDPASWEILRQLPALPLPLKVGFALDWARLAPWHWAQWIIALAGAGMLALAGHARSQDVNGNWQDYWRRSEWHLPLMAGLQRVRALATVALLLMALGALLLLDPAWQAWLRVPPAWIAALEQFYRLPSLPPP